MNINKSAVMWSFVVALSLLVLTLVSPRGASASPGLVTQDLNSGLTTGDLANALVGGGVTVSNITYSGNNIAAGFFSGGSGIIGFENGIMLATGNIADVVGPNKFDDTSTVLDTPGDAGLDSLIPGFLTYDSTILEFDFVPNNSVLKFDYVFGSEEYNEYVNSQFNDVFGFFVNGSNIALIPGSITPVAIDNVNGGNPFGVDASNSQFYRNNSISDPGPATIDTELDGLTTIFSAVADVNPGVVNHIKLGIADAGDRILDSAVFIRAGSLTSPNLALGPVNSANLVGTSHTLTATATLGGIPQPGLSVSFQVTNGPNAGLSGTGVTNISGQATFSYTGNLTGVDTISGTALIGGVANSSNNAFKNWISSSSGTLHLLPGWNMVSVPLHLSDNSTAAVFPEALAVFTWDPETKSYAVPATIEPHKGYWVAVAANTNITLAGTPVGTWTSDLKAGWNMVGSVSGSASFLFPKDDPNNSVLPTLYWYDPTTRSYQVATNIEPGKGYWAAAVQDCDLTVP